MSGKKLKILQELSLEKVSISEDQEKKKKNDSCLFASKIRRRKVVNFNTLFCICY